MKETKFPGICRHARKLGVSREHLRLVLNSDRPSPKLFEAYKAILAHEKACGIPSHPLTLPKGTRIGGGTIESLRKTLAEMIGEFGDVARMDGEEIVLTKTIRGEFSFPRDPEPSAAPAPGGTGAV